MTLNLTGNNELTEKRRQLISELRQKPELDPKVLDAMSVLPRELFVIPTFHLRSYEDSALPIDCNQTISQPYTVAYMTSKLNVKHGDRILEIGTGSGYQAALLYLLGAKVFSIERISQLYQNANTVFRNYGLKVATRLGDGTLGWKEFAPYNGIIITAAAPEVPKSLLDQLSNGGRMVVPVGDKTSQTMMIIEKSDDGIPQEIYTEKFKFVPLIGKEGWSGK